MMCCKMVAKIETNTSISATTTEPLDKKHQANDLTSLRLYGLGCDQGRQRGGFAKANTQNI